MKNLSMHKITLQTFIIIIASFSLSFIIISSFLKQNEQVNKFYENIKLTVEVVNDVLVNDFEKAIINYSFSDINPSFISMTNPIKSSNNELIKKFFAINIFYIGKKNNYLYFKIINKDIIKYLKLDLIHFLDIHFSNLDLNFNYYITDNNNIFVYGNKSFYEKYNNIQYIKDIYKIKSFYTTKLDFFKINNKPLLKIYVFFKPSIFDFPLNYIKTFLFSIILTIIISLIYHFYLFRFIMFKFNLNKELIKKITLNSIIEKEDDFEIIDTSIPEFNELFQDFFRIINTLKLPLKNALSENKKLRANITKTEKENLAILTFLSTFKKFLYGKNNYRTFDLTIKRLNEELPFESELLKQNLNNLFNKLSIKIIEIENIKNNYYSQLEILFNIIGSMSEIKEYDVTHNILMGKISYYLGEKLELNEIQLKSLYYGAKIHDLGKIFIPDKILLKNGKLNNEEWNIIKKHPKYGLIILNNLKIYPFLNIGKIIISHHEKWNGKGYPYGLSEKEIPLEGRIVSIVDSLIALITDRPYRSAYSYEDALKIIELESGKSFDPELVSILLKHKNQIKNIIEQELNKK
ncbi:HD-GYP domain-containing protein [Marinitoga aeolica]|uniref:HD domain-containing protein n=1 Tax=Marinitoga aeolica TaxID=2809031 RepID=A0ABY8PR81_9BACT|nr:HD domain-containing phosphohydrolase [Marinitoga aeolica]WGS65128.1 HD domain-containing protein [Marinitoga aeolica]